MLCAWNAFKSLSAAFYSFHRPSALKEWFRWWWHMALSFGIRCLVDSRRASKPDTEVVGSAERTLTDVSWASSLLVRCVKATGHHIWHLSLRRLPHFRVCRLSNRLPKAVSYGPLRHGDWRSKPLEHYEAMLSKIITSQRWPCNLQTYHHLPQKRNSTCPRSFYKPTQTNTV